MARCRLYRNSPPKLLAQLNPRSTSDIRSQCRVHDKALCPPNLSSPPSHSTLPHTQCTSLRAVGRSSAPLGPWPSRSAVSLFTNTSRRTSSSRYERNCQFVWTTMGLIGHSTASVFPRVMLRGQQRRLKRLQRRSVRQLMFKCVVKRN